MGNKRKNDSWEKEPYECIGNDKLFSQMYSTMLLSEAFLSLSGNQKSLYLYCKFQRFGEKDKHLLSTDEKPYGDKMYFSMNRHKYQENYKLYKKGNHNGFQRDMAELINKGFIDCVACGWYSKQRTIYAFSERWKLYGTENYQPPTYQQMTTFMINEIRDKQ